MRSFHPIATLRATRQNGMHMPGRPDTLNMHEANERTMLAWLRTGISLMGFGFAIARFGLYLHEQALAEHLELGRIATRTAGSGFVGAALVGIG
jgi:putative membrane protein